MGSFGHVQAQKHVVWFWKKIRDVWFTRSVLSPRPPLIMGPSHFVNDAVVQIV